MSSPVANRRQALIANHLLIANHDAVTLAPAPVVPAAAAAEAAHDKSEDVALWSATDLPDPVVTSHTVHVKGATMEYKARAGLLPIVLEETAGPAGSMFFVDCEPRAACQPTHDRINADSPPRPVACCTDTLDDGGDPSTRPLSFCFNGGPGSASCWLHLGGLGPKKVHLLPDGGMPPPPYHLEDNDETWLPTTDLVFVDAMGTGYSRPSTKEDGPKFWGCTEDLTAFTEFIRYYVTKYNRWCSPCVCI